MRHPIAGLGLGGLLAALTLAPAVSAAKLPRLESLKPISGKSGFMDCGLAPPPPFHEADIQPDDTAVEPRIAVDPNDPRRMAAAWMQDMAGGIVVSATTDGGRTWRNVTPPKTSGCTGGSGGAFDPAITYGADGSLYLSLMRNVELQPARTTPDNEVAVLASRDGGATWSDPVVVQPRKGTMDYHDYPTVAADPENPGRVYVAWVWSIEPGGGHTVGSYLAVSDDGGRTFSAPRRFFSAPRIFYSHQGHIVAGPDGRLAYAMDLYDSQNFLPLPGEDVPNSIVALRSADRGVTWSAPATVMQVAPEVDVHDAETGEWTEPGAIQLAASPDGTFWIVARDITPEGQRLLVSRSTDQGWSSPTTVVLRNPGQVMLPSIAAGPDGAVALSWYDTQRDRPGDDSFDADVWMAVSTDRGATWENLHVAGPVNLRRAYDDPRAFEPGLVVRFLGDYVGLAATRRGFVAALPLTRPIGTVGQSQMFVATVRAREPASRPRGARKRANRDRCRRAKARRKCRRRG